MQHNVGFTQISNSIMLRLSTYSSNEDIFTQIKQDNEIALRIVDIKKKLEHKSREHNSNIQNKCHIRKRKNFMVHISI